MREGSRPRGFAPGISARVAEVSGVAALLVPREMGARIPMLDAWANASCSSCASLRGVENGADGIGVLQGEEVVL